VIETEAQLLERFQAGDAAAFDELFTRLYASVHRVAFGLVQDYDLADDIAQEALVSLYRQPPQLEGGSPVAWICRVAINRGYNMLRGMRREQVRLAQLEAPGSGADPFELLERAERRDAVRQALRLLPERQAHILALRYGGLSYTEIAAAIEVAPGSVGTLLARAERAFVAAYATIAHDDQPQSAA
jgi:RNA polymerase sigma-70 factor (ECF subfamily)